jgi:hypothetical protein
MSSRKTITLFFGALIVPMLAVFAFAFQNAAVQEPELSQKINLSDIKLWRVGSSGRALDSVLSQARKLNVNSDVLTLENFSSNATLKYLVLNRLSVIAFDGLWLQEQQENSEIISFLNQTAKDVGGFIVVGGNLTTLLEVSDSAGIYRIFRNQDGSVRNPLSQYAEIAGVRLQRNVKPNGGLYYSSELFGGSAEDPELINRIALWIGR